MDKYVEVRRQSKMKIHLIYRRIPDRILERDDEVIDDLKDVIVAKAKFEDMKSPLYVNGIKVIENGYVMLYFAFVGERYDILKIYDKEGKYKGIYVDILFYTKRYDNVLEMLDLFLDIFMFPDGEFYLLDNDEIQIALREGVIDKESYALAYLTAGKIIRKIKNGNFPPKIVNDYSL